MTKKAKKTTTKKTSKKATKKPVAKKPAKKASAKKAAVKKTRKMLPAVKPVASVVTMTDNNAVVVQAVGDVAQAAPTSTMTVDQTTVTNS